MTNAHTWSLKALVCTRCHFMLRPFIHSPWRVMRRKCIILWAILQTTWTQKLALRMLCVSLNRHETTKKKVLNSESQIFCFFPENNITKRVWVHIAIFKYRKIKEKKFILMTAYWFDIAGWETIVWLMPNFGNDKTPAQKIDRFLTTKNTSLYRRRQKEFYCSTDKFAE